MLQISKSLQNTLQTLVSEEGIEWFIQENDLIVLVRMTYVNTESPVLTLDLEGRRKYRDISLQLGVQYAYERIKELSVLSDGRERWVYSVLPSPF